MKRLLFYLIIPFVGAVLLFKLTGDKEEVDIFQGKEHYGTLILSSEIEGLLYRWNLGVVKEKSTGVGLI